MPRGEFKNLFDSSSSVCRRFDLHVAPPETSSLRLIPASTPCLRRKTLQPDYCTGLKGLASKLESTRIVSIKQHGSIASNNLPGCLQPFHKNSRRSKCFHDGNCKYSGGKNNRRQPEKTTKFSEQSGSNE